MNKLPGWLLHRARIVGATHAWTILAPATERSSAMYLLACGSGVRELHVVDDAASGVDGVTIPMTTTEAGRMLASLAGTLSGRMEGVPLNGRAAMSDPPPPVEAPPVPAETKP